MSADEPVAMLAPVRHPWWAAAAVTVGWRVAVVVAAFTVPPLAPAAFPQLGALVVNVVACLVPLAVIARLGWWRMPWLVALRPQRWTPLAPLAVLYGTRLIFGWDLTWDQSLVTLIFVLVAAASEELYSRGVVQELLRAVRPLWRAVAVGSLFGMGHILSGVVFGRDAGYLAFQVPHAVVQGFALAALRMLVVSLWPLVVLHAESNLLVLAEPPGAVPAWWEALQLLVMLTVGLFAVRHHERSFRDQSATSGDRTSARTRRSAPRRECS
ncbi:MAG: CPBP family intramembrane glutamic endopeptidase [Nakamurella sp.]